MNGRIVELKTLHPCLRLSRYIAWPRPASLSNISVRVTINRVSAVNTAPPVCDAELFTNDEPAISRLVLPAQIAPPLEEALLSLNTVSLTIRGVSSANIPPPLPRDNCN